MVDTALPAMQHDDAIIAGLHIMLIRQYKASISAGPLHATTGHTTGR